MTHNLLECRFHPETDRQGFGKSRLIGSAEDLEEPNLEDGIANLTCMDSEDRYVPDALLDKPAARRVDVVQSPFLNTHYRQYPVRLTLDTGATTNMIKSSFAQAIGIPTNPASQMARQADGVTPLDVTGEVHCQLTRGDQSFTLDALVVKQLDVDVLAGNPFLVTNDIATRPAKR